MRIDFAARVDIGVRESNDDRALVGGRILDMASQSGTLELPAIAVVCDGCGGYMGGGTAAQTVLERLAEEEPGSLADPDRLAETLEDCRRRVYEKKAEMPQFSEMCTTVAGCVFSEDGIVLFHAGDSRVYRSDMWGVARMTRDHSLVQEMVDMGEIAPEEALTHPKRNVINRCIGIECRAPEIYVSHAALVPGEKYLLCSDGLWESVSEQQINEVLDSGMTLAEMADALVETALSQGSDDNTSVCICMAQAEPDKAEVPEPEPDTAEAGTDEIDNKPFISNQESAV